MSQQSVGLRWKVTQEESLPRLLNLNRKAMLSSRMLGTTYQWVWHIPDDLNPLLRYSISVVSPYIAVYAYVCHSVREDSVKAVWHYRELHKLTVGINVAGSYIFISLWNAGYFGSMSWNFQGCPWGIVIFACCVASKFMYMFCLHNCLIPQCLQNLICTLCCILKLFLLCISDKYMHLLQTTKCRISCTYNSTDVA